MRGEYKKSKIYAVYRGGRYLFEGTSVECAKRLGVKLPYFYTLSSPSHREKITGKNGLYAFKLKELLIDEDDEFKEVLEVICPVCKEKARTVFRNEVVEHYTIYRTYECKDCLTRFKTTEKIIFSSIPKYIRDKFLDEGVRP